MRSDGIVPVMEVGTNNRNGNGMFGDNWAWIIVLFLIFAWGGYGNGFGRNNGSVADNYVLASDYYKYTSPLTPGELSDRYPTNLKIRDVIKKPSDAPFVNKDEKLRYDKSQANPMPKPNFIETNKIIGR